MDSHGELAHARSVGSDARRVVLLLAKATRDFQQIVRQRRFGNQRFVYFPTDRQSLNGRAVEQCCVVCLRRFGIFRKDHYCQLCGHLVCRQCSKKHKVEPLAGKVRENRICFPCVARVDSGAFHDQQLWRNLGGRAVVVDDEAISPVGFEPVLTDAVAHERGRGSLEMVPRELATDDDERAGLDNSYGSGGSTSTAPSSARHEVQLAQDLFSPHPQRRASALEALGRVVLETRQSFEQQTPKSSRAEKPKAQTTPQTPRTKSDRMQTFSVCYPRANPTASRSFTSKMTPLLESADQPPRDSLTNRLQKGHPRSSFSIDTAAFDSICEALVQRLGCSMAFLVVQRRKARQPQIVGMHQSSQIRGHLPRHLDLASYCPSGLTIDGRPLVVIDPTRDLRFRGFPLIHEARIRFFAEFPLRGLTGPSVGSASLCVLDTDLRDQQVSKDELKTVKTLCAVASDLVSSISQ
jgi:hypothetical protein